MTRTTLAAMAIAAATAASAYLFPTNSAHAADPVCESGFQTVQKKSWILKCSKTAPMSQKGVLLTQAYNANCNTSSYWNFGPKVDAEHLRRNTMVKVDYTCGHVEG
jgi:hypothetical protein